MACIALACSTDRTQQSANPDVPGEPASQAAISDTATARDFVQRFYRWYSRQPNPLATTLADSGYFLVDSLNRALKVDAIGQAVRPGELAGLDFDPFTASQDPCERYEPQRVVLGQHPWVVVQGICAGRPVGPEIIVVVGIVGSGYRILNVRFQDSTNLMQLLAQYQADRALAH